MDHEWYRTEVGRGVRQRRSPPEDGPPPLSGRNQDRSAGKQPLVGKRERSRERYTARSAVLLLPHYYQEKEREGERERERIESRRERENRDLEEEEEERERERERYKAAEVSP